jgi:hypothetical protein
MEKYLKPESKEIKIALRSALLEASGSAPGDGGNGDDINE